MRGNFLQNFINVLLGFVLVTFLPNRLFHPLTDEFVSKVVSDEILRNTANVGPSLSNALQEIAKTCATKIASDYKDQRVNLFDSDGTAAFCNEFEIEIKKITTSQPNSIETDRLAQLKSNIRNALSDAITSEKWLFFAIVLFAIKYLHELSRVEDLFHGRVALPAVMNFIHFVCSLLLAAAIVLLIIYSNTFIPWWLLPAILIGFAINDLSLLAAKIGGWLEASVAKRWGVQWRIILTWLVLDVAILVLSLLYFVKNPPRDSSPISWNFLLAYLLLSQVAFPYMIGFDFYFRDYVDEAAAQKSAS